jgi:hypothetical protein
MGLYEELQEGVVPDGLLYRHKLVPRFKDKYDQVYYHKHGIWVTEIVNAFTGKVMKRDTAEKYYILLDVMKKQREKYQ